MRPLQDTTDVYMRMHLHPRHKRVGAHAWTVGLCRDLGYQDAEDTLTHIADTCHTMLCHASVPWHIIRRTKSCAANTMWPLFAAIGVPTDAGGA